MKRFCNNAACFLMVFLLAFAVVPGVSFASTMQGTGTAENPFIITTEAQLAGGNHDEN